MDAIAYETKRGKILQVMRGQTGFRTYELNPKTGGAWATKDIAALPERETIEEAQQDLDAYALQQEYNPVMPPEENTPEGQEAPDEGEQKAEEVSTTPDEEMGSSHGGGAAPPTDTQTPEGPEAFLDEEATRRLHHLQDLLERCCGRLISTKMDKASQVAHFNGIIKGIEAQMANLLQLAQAARYEIEHPSPQRTLPLGSDPAPQTPAGTDEVPDEQPPEVAPEEPSFEEDLPADGPGPQAELQAVPCEDEDPSPPNLFREHAICYSCNHAWDPAHFDADGIERPCAVAGCGCLAAVTERKMQDMATSAREACP